MSLTAEPIERAYLESRESLAMERMGGARAEVDVVEVLRLDDLEPEGDGFRADVEWTVAGSVTPFGHRHFRQNLYRGRIASAPVDGSWKIHRLEVRSVDRQR